MPPLVERSPLSVSGWALAVGLALAPAWSLFPARELGALSVGRAVLVVAAAGLALGALALHRRGRLGRPPLVLLGLLVALGGLASVIVASAASRGCFCAGSVPGYLELASFLLAVALQVALAPRFRVPLLVAAAAGAVLSAGLALAGVHELSGSSPPSMTSSVRLGGTFGNPNLLAIAVAGAVPLVVGVAPWRRPRILPLAILALGVGGTALVLSYSRGGLLAAAVGGIVALVASASTRRGALVAGGLALVVGTAVGTLIYPAYSRDRTRADFPPTRTTTTTLPDMSGWDRTAQGLISVGPSRLFNPTPDVLAVASDRRGEGVSLRLSRVRAGQKLTVSFTAASHGGNLPLRFGMEDNIRANGPIMRAGITSSRGRRFVISWRPRRDSPDARLYVWQTAKPGVVQLTRVSARPDTGPSRPLSTRLRGPDRGGRQRDLDRAERRFVRSRIDAASTALDAFRSAPILGIGWQRFPAYARTRLGYAIATHDEYLRVAAELGVVGLLMLALLLVAVAASLRSVLRSDLRAPLLGALATGLVALGFVNGLATPAPSLALTAAIGVAVGTVGWPRRLD